MFINFPMNNNASKVEVVLKKTFAKMSPVSVFNLFLYFFYSKKQKKAVLVCLWVYCYCHS